MPAKKAPVTTAPAAPAPTAHDHEKLLTFLQILNALAPAVAAPFIKNPNSQQIVATESGALAAALAAIKH